MTIMRSLVVPKEISRTIPAVPSLSADNSANRGTILPLVAIAINYTIMISRPKLGKNTSISGPPTQRTAGSSRCINK